MEKYGITRSVFLMLLLLTVSCNAGKSNREKDVFYPVSRVVDGDTFWVDDGSEKGMKIRLIGVDTPETVHPTKEVQEYGKEASDYLKEMLTGNEVRLEFDVDSLDRYDRTLAYVYLRNGTFVNAALVKNGYARVSTIPPNVKYAATFLKLERQARKGNRGLWGVID